jgi:hypothetical protein
MFGHEETSFQKAEQEPAQARNLENCINACVPDISGSHQFAVGDANFDATARIVVPRS